MDTKQLFRFFNSKFGLTNWLNENGELAQNQGDVAWLYCGINEDFKSEFVRQKINETFGDEDIYLCISSNNSSLVSTSEAVTEIAKMLHKKEIGIMDKSFTKMMFFNSYGTFKSGIIREFPESRPRPDGHRLKTSFFANMAEKNTIKVADAVNKYFEHFEKALHNDYGGIMEYLWIDKQKKLGNFDAAKFRSDFQSAMETVEYS